MKDGTVGLAVITRYGDTVKTMDSTLSTNVENLTLIGTDVVNRTGNRLNNVLVANTEPTQSSVQYSSVQSHHFPWDNFSADP